jgi:hypothetical protein
VLANLGNASCLKRDAGLQSFAIPHNANLSNGLMFAPRNSYGMPIDAAYARKPALV